MQGKPVLKLCLSMLLFVLAWGCASEGDPFGRDLKPVMAITAVQPADGAVEVSPDVIVTIAFPLELDARTVSRQTVHLLDYTQSDQLPSDLLSKNAWVFPAKVIYDATRRIVTLIPDQPLKESGRYQVTLQDVRSTRDVIFNTVVTTFRTGRSGRTEPQVLSIRPLPGQVMVFATSTIDLTFSRPMDHASLLSALSVGPGVAGTAAFVESPNTVLTFRPGNRFTPGQIVQVTVRGDVKDVNGVPMGRSYNSLFTVEPPPRVIPEFTDPADNAIRVARNSPVTVVFSTTMTTQTVANAFNLVYGSTFLGQNNGTFTFQTVGSPPRTTATFRSTSPLPASISVQIRVNGLARSTRQMGLSPLFFSTFVTDSL